MEETVTYEQDLEQQDPIPKPKKLKIKDFAAKIKAKYPDYKDIDDTELTNKIITKYPEYKDQVDLTTEVKKKSGSIGFEESSLQAGNVLSQSGGVGGEEIPQIEMYTLPNGEMVETDPVSISRKYKELKDRKKTVTEGVGSSFGMGTGTTKEVEDEESQKAADKLAKDFEGLDIEGINDDTQGLSDDLIRLYKNDILPDREENNQLYQRKLANIKWRSSFEKKLLEDVDNGNIDPDNYNRIKHGIEQLPISTGQGDYSNQRAAVKSLAADIREYGGENRDKLLKDFAVEVSKVYGNPDNKAEEKFKDSPESKYLNTDAQLGYQYLQDVSPDKAEQYKRLFIDPKSLKDNPDELRGYNHLMQTLEETGINLKQNAVTEELNSLNKQAKMNGGLTPEQTERATKLEKVNEELSAKRNELDSKYPDRIGDKIDDAVQEVMGQKISGFNYAGGKAFNAIRNTAQGVWEAASSPFMSDESNTLRELAIMGQSLEDEKIYHKTDKNKALQYDAMVIKPELQKEVDLIKNNNLLTDDQKEQKLYKLFRENTDKFGRVPIKGGKFNVSPSSIMYGMTDLGTSLLPFVAIEAATGGIGGAGAGAKFLRTFTAAAATTFHDEYAAALMEGKSQSEAYRSAMASTAINSLAMAGAGTPTEIRAMASTKTSAGKLIQSMSDDAIEAVLKKGTPKGLKAVAQNVKERLKATPEMLKQGVKTGAKFEAYMSAANAINGREQDFKRSLLAIGEFGILGAALGQAAFKTPTQLQKSAGLEFGKKPDEYIAIAESMKKDGLLTDAQLEQRTELIKSYGEAYKSLPKNLDEKQQREYLYETVIKNEATKGKSNLPPKQAAEAEHQAMVADYMREIILDQPTEKELESRKSYLEKQLEKKDEEGKLLLDEKEAAKVKAQIEAIDTHLDTTKKEVKEEELPNLSQPIEGVNEKGIPIGENVPPEVKGQPEQITQPIELSVEQKGKDVVVDEGEVEPKVETTKTEENAVQEQTTNEMDVRQQTTNGEGVGEGNIQPEIPTQKGEVKGEEVKVGDISGNIGGITHAANEVRRKDRGLPEYEKQPESFEQWNTEAENLIRNGYDVEALMNRIQYEKHDPTPVENAIRKIYYATIDAEIAKNPTDKLLAIQKRLATVGDLANSRLGRSLVSLKGQGSPLSSISDFYVAKMDALGKDVLTDAQKEEVKRQYEEVQKTNEEAALKIQKLEEENAKLRAEAELAKSRTTIKKEKKDFIKEREDIKKSIIDKWNKSKNVGFAADPSKDLLMDIAPDVAKLVKSYIQEGVVKLEEIVNKVHDELKGYIPDISKKNINDIIAGQYDKPKETKGDLLARLRGIKDKKSEEAVKILARIKAGDFSKQEKTVSWVENTELKKKFPKEYNEALDAIKAKEDARHEFDIALLRDQMARRTPGEKFTDWLSKGAGTVKAITTGIDDSAVAIQTYVSMLVRPRTGVKAFYQHLRQGVSQKKFDRWLSALHSSPDFKEMRDMGLDVTEPSSLKEREKEEIFNNRFNGTVKIKGKEYKLLDAPLKPFERAFTTLGNVTRVVGYRTISAKYKREGYTPENNPELFKSLAKRLNTETGRGSVNEYVDMANKVVTMGIWSPKLMAQKFNILGISDLASLVLSKSGTKGYYRQLHPKERIAAIVDVAQFATTVMALSYGFALAFGGDIDTDPLSSTFMDIKLPNGKSYNFTAGFSGYIRAIFQFAMGEKHRDGRSEKARRLNTAARFFRSKTPPLTSAALNLAGGKDFMYQPTTPINELTNLAPISMRGIYDQIQRDGANSFFTQGIPTFFGFNIKNEKDFENKKSTKPKKKPKKQEKK